MNENTILIFHSDFVNKTETDIRSVSLVEKVKVEFVDSPHKRRCCVVAPEFNLSKSPP